MTSELVHHGQSFDDQPLGFGTKSIHLGNGVDKETGAIRRPITLANAYALPYDPSDINWSSSDVNLYTRNGHPNQRYLEAKLANLEGAEDAVVLASGVAALAATFTTFLNRGDHAIFSTRHTSPRTGFSIRFCPRSTASKPPSSTPPTRPTYSTPSSRTPS